jgi:predicted phage baseplate assembly protein
LKKEAEAYTSSAPNTLRRIELRRKEALNEPIDIFPASLAPGDAFCLALEGDHSNNMLALKLKVANAGGSGVNPKEPPIRWEVWHAEAGGYQPCEVEQDSTGGFNDDGEVVLHVPAMSEQEVGPDRGTAFLLCCRLTEGQADRNRNYKQSPQLTRLQIEVRGGTAQARQAVVVRNEVLGQSDGTPGQTFQLKHAPLLARDPQHEHLLVELDDATEVWQEVQDFADSGPDDRHYTLDSQDGKLTFGPLLPQPNGEAYSFGAVPAPESKLIFSQYQYGGGVDGNVPRGSIRVLKSAIPFVTRVANRRDATGGQNAQLLEDAKLRAPRRLRDRTRAVTTDDYEYLARNVKGVAAARSLGPGAQPGEPDDLQPGQVLVVVLPALTDEALLRRAEPLPAHVLSLSEGLHNEVYKELAKRSLLGTDLRVHGPRYVQVVIEVRVRLQERSSPEQRAAIKQQAEMLLYRYLNPYTGGPGEKGWVFGRSLHNAEIYSLLQQHIEGVEFIEKLDIHASDPDGRNPPKTTATRVEVPGDGIICSGKHQVTVG